MEQRFTGQIRDTGTGLDYFNARYYTAPLGRFNSADPGNTGADLSDPQTWNGYAYVRNNPLVLSDQSGLFLDGTTAGAAAGGPVGAAIGGLIDLFGALFGLFGGGGGHAAPPPPPPTPPVSSYPVPTFSTTVTDRPPKNGTYRTLDCEGYRAVRSILPQTTKQGREFGGFLYQNSNGRYSYSNPVAGEPTSIPDLFKSPQAFVSGIVGWFHTHPLVPGFNNDRFSGSDLLITRKEGPGYLGTASGRTLKLAIDPKGFPHNTDVNSGACQVP